MKVIIMQLWLVLLITSCNIENHDSLYTRFQGTVPAVESMTEQGEPEIIPPQDFVVVFNADSVIFQGESYPYTITEESPDFLTLQTEIMQSGEAMPLTFRFDLESEELLMINIAQDMKITLLKQEELFEQKLASFASAKLSSNLSHLSVNQKEMLKILFQISDIMDELFWKEAFGNKELLMEGNYSETLKELFRINYGPWERLNNDQALLDVFGQKYPGANFYPQDMTRQEFEAFDNPYKTSQYTLIRRDENNDLKVVWYREAFNEQITRAANLLRQAAELAEDEGFRNYLLKRAEAFETDEYYESDVAWMKMKNNDIDFVVGPIENYEDKLFNYKAAHESFILIKDWEWSNQIARLAGLLPELQRELPVPEEFKRESPGSSSDLNVYDAIYYAGDCNAGSKTIAINLPNDPAVRGEYGSRKLQLKNSIRYKFEKILVPIANVLIDEEQRQYVDFNAFFENTMFHEVAHGLGVNYTINGKGEVREALKEAYSPIEEGKADILGLYIVSKLTEKGELGEKDLMENYVTFMASIFRSIRFGAASAHGKANMIRFYYFEEKGAFTRDEESGTYKIDFEKMKEAMNDMTKEIITLQGLGQYEKAMELIEDKGYIRPQLQKDLDRLNAMQIPVDLVFEQGQDVAGL